MALVTCVHGGGAPDTQETLVLNNNSTHYLVAHREANAPSAVLYESFTYCAADGDAERAYIHALHMAVNLAKGW